MVRRDEQYYYLFEVSEDDQEAVRAAYPSDSNGQADCMVAYGRECGGKLSHFVAEYLEHVTVGVAIVVVAVPEGLPLAVMISLAYSVQRML